VNFLAIRTVELPDMFAARLKRVGGNEVPQGPKLDSLERNVQSMTTLRLSFRFHPFLLSPGSEISGSTVTNEFVESGHQNSRLFNFVEYGKKFCRFQRRNGLLNIRRLVIIKQLRWTDSQ
jgi:hypothetical protein